MGLDITAVGDIMTEKTHGDAYLVMQEMSIVDSFYINKSYPNACKQYETEDGDAKVGYLKSGTVEDASFRVGSYKDYNKFRGAICKAILGVDIEAVWDNESKFEGQPFINLFIFSDCEGAIDSVVSKTLAGDFLSNRQSFVDHIKEKSQSEFKEEDNNDVSLYDQFAQAFTVAANDGVIMFC